MNIGDKPRIAIVGAGAVGGYYGARLAQHGHDVHFLLRGDYEAVRDNGWTIRSCDGDFVLPAESVRAYDDVRRMPRPDLAIVTLKATSNDAYEALLGPLIGDATEVLTLQNGLGNEDVLATLFGAGRVLGGMAFVCINRVAPGVISHTDHGTIRLGEYGGGPGPRAARVAALLNGSGVRCEVLSDLRLGRWQKLVWNVPFNGLGATLDLTTDQLIGTDDGVALVTALMEEIIATAGAEGVRLPADTVVRQIEHTRSMGAYRSSTQVDRQQGRAMEVEAIFGEPLRRARAAGVATPNLEVLYRNARVVDAALRL
jgi:2-dehydropantoate 2-reductase